MIQIFIYVYNNKVILDYNLQYLLWIEFIKVCISVGILAAVLLIFFFFYKIDSKLKDWIQIEWLKAGKFNQRWNKNYYSYLSSCYCSLSAYFLI